MKPWMIVVLIIVLLLAAIVLQACFEIHHLQAVFYTISTEKLNPEEKIRAVFLSDLHDRKYGDNNEELLQLVKEQKPDYIFTGGDMLTSSNEEGFSDSLSFFRMLSEIAPVYAAPGNHEKRLMTDKSDHHQAFLKYDRDLRDAGICPLENEEAALGRNITLHGLDIDFKYYNKLKRPHYEPEEIQKDLASIDRKRFNIVLAHNPRFFKTYAESGADLFLAGHYHGGAVRIGGKIGLISPQFVLLPRYSRGLYRENGTTMIVSAGCGSHKVNLRVMNKPEIVVIDIHGSVV